MGETIMALGAIDCAVGRKHALSLAYTPVDLRGNPAHLDIHMAELVKGEINAPSRVVATIPDTLASRLVSDEVRECNACVDGPERSCSFLLDIKPGASQTISVTELFQEQ